MTKLRAPGPSSLLLARDRRPGGTRETRFACAVCIAMFCLATAISAPAQTFTSLFSFDGSNGADPHYGSLLQGTDGQLYGMTGHGGLLDCGTVFTWRTKEGFLVTLSDLGSDGCNPDGGLMYATNGNFYGSTTNGGTFGSGTLFFWNGSGQKTIHEFNFTEGANTNSALVETPTGNFFGTTVNGGNSISCCDGGGVIFKITPSGVYTVLHFFDFTDGWDPQDATLIQATDGNLYGEAAGGGTNSCPSPAIGCGTIYRICPTGSFEVLHDFNGKDGSIPYGGLIQASDGNFYGTTYYGGAHSEGTVFRFTPPSSLATIYSFSGPDGAQPRGHLIQATDGNLYGTTWAGGTNSAGTIFKITTAGQLTTLHDFDGTDGTGLNSGLVQATNGTFYGITSAGGTNGDGTIFSLNTGLSPFVSFVLSAGGVGQTVVILGQGLTGTTAVSFNGTPAVFGFPSDTYLTATVPAGATTGFVTVTTPSGTLTSNEQFHVVPQILSFSPTSGPVGTTVVITGESFLEATEVAFCGDLAKFTVNSDTQITATVPAGAMTCPIAVQTPGGHVESAAGFTVTP
jgi:uncharacterized repeat protein (TIGR03803 family)